MNCHSIPILIQGWDDSRVGFLQNKKMQTPDSPPLGPIEIQPTYDETNKKYGLNEKQED